MTAAVWAWDRLPMEVVLTCQAQEAVPRQMQPRPSSVQPHAPPQTPAAKVLLTELRRSTVHLSCRLP